MKKEKTSYMDSVYKWGSVWSVAALLVLISVPLSFSIKYNAWPEAGLVLKALSSVVLIYWTTSIIEIVTYIPIIGAGGSYLSFVTGNIANLKLPCSLSAMDNAKVKPNTEEGEVISTIAVGVSAIVTTLIIALGVLLFGPVLPKLTAPDSVFAPAFTHVLPALFGALGASYFAKHWKISIFPIIMGCVVLLFSPTLPVGTLMVVTIVAAIGGALLMFKLKWIG